MARTLSLAALALLLSVSLATAQVVTDRFNYTPGTSSSNWQEEGGDWTYDGNTVHAAPSAVQQFLLRQVLPPKRDAAVQVEATYENSTNQSNQAVGLVERYDARGTEASYLEMRLGDSDASGDFDSLWLLHVSASGATTTLAYQPLTHPTRNARLRLIVLTEMLFTHIIAQADTAMNNVWSEELEVYTTLHTQVTGSYGLCAFGGGRFDNFKIFDAVLYPRNAAVIGTTLSLHARSLSTDPYQAGCAGLNLGMDAWGTLVPLWPDDLLLTSLALPDVFKAFAGYMNSSGNATLEIDIPDDTTFVGLTFYTAFFTFRWLPTTQVTSVSNDVQRQIQK